MKHTAPGCTYLMSSCKLAHSHATWCFSHPFTLSPSGPFCGSAVLCAKIWQSQLRSHTTVVAELNSIDLTVSVRFCCLLASISSLVRKGPHGSGRHLPPEHCHPHACLTCRRTQNMSLPRQQKTERLCFAGCNS